MNKFDVIGDRLDIVQYIKDNGKVSLHEIYDVFFDGIDEEKFRLELDIMFDKSKKALKLGNSKGYIDFDGEYFTYIDLKS